MTKQGLTNSRSGYIIEGRCNACEGYAEGTQHHHAKRLVRRENGSRSIELPHRDGITIGYWIKPSPFPGTPAWEWVITNMPVTVVTGMSAGYTDTREQAEDAALRALDFWHSLGYVTVPWEA